MVKIRFTFGEDLLIFRLHLWKKQHPHNPSSNKTYKTVPPNNIPRSESLKNTFERVIPYYEWKYSSIAFYQKKIF